MALQIFLLGPLRIEHDGRSLPERAWRSRQARRLLAALLIARGAGVPAPRLIEWLWPGTDQESAAITLRSTISNLRQTLAPGTGRAANQYIETRHGGYAWNTASDAWIDLEAFYAALEPNDHSLDEARLEHAIGLYRGNLFEDDPDAAWVIPAREQAHQRFLSAIEQLCERKIEHAAYAEAIRTAQRGLAFEPLREPICRALMRAQALNGDVAAALQSYARFQLVLDHELGALPAPATQALHAAILRGTSELELRGAPAPKRASRRMSMRPSQASPPAPRPTALTPLVGRAIELAQLRAWVSALERRTGGVVALVGEAGIGKSRLITELAQEIQQRGQQPILMHCRLSDRGLPFAALLEALRPIIRAAPITLLRHLPQAALAQLAEHMPALRERMANLPTPAAIGPDESRNRMIEAMVELALALSAIAPLVVCCDDAQWADLALLAAIGRLARHTPRRALLLILSYRPEELSESAGLHGLLRELGREMLLRPLILGPLDLAATRMLLGGQDPQQQERIAPLAQRLEAYSTGNPLLLEVAIQALLDANGVATPAALPSTIDLEIPLSAASQAAPIRNLIGARIDRLPTNARMLLEQLAMLDRSVSLDLIEHLGGEEALAHAQILLDRHFLIDIGDDRLDFRHRTVRASIVALLGSPRRRLLHRQIAHALAALHGDRIERAAEIARHLEQAGRGFERELVRYSTLAGDYARQLFGYSEALYWYEHALAVAAQLGSQAPADLVEQAQAGRAALQQSNQPR